MTNKEKELRLWLQKKIRTEEKWAIKALIIVSGHQTKEEKTIGMSRGRDMSGFNLYDGERMNYLAAYYEYHGKFEKGQLAIIKSEMQKYWKQIVQNIGEAKLYQEMNEGKQLKLF